MTDSVDLLIRGGTIVDGTGAPGRPGSVAVEGDRLRVLAADDATPHAGRTIDATGRVVAPGFIDLHSHGGLVILADPRHEPKVRQGVTTELVGVDGLSYAPFLDNDDLQQLREMNAGLDGDPDGIGWDWAERRELPRSARRPDASTSPRSSATRRSGSPRSAGTTARRTRRRSRASGRSSGRRWRTARSG